MDVFAPERVFCSQSGNHNINLACRGEVTKNTYPKNVFPQASLQAFQHRYFDKLFGLFSDSHMQYHLLNDNAVEPSLIEMTQRALQMVSKNPNGYVLLIESGRIDHGHHETKAKLALDETKHFEEVVEYIRSQVNESETLIVVTPDHSHTMSVSGYPISEFPF